MDKIEGKMEILYECTEPRRIYIHPRVAEVLGFLGGQDALHSIKKDLESMISYDPPTFSLEGAIFFGDRFFFGEVLRFGSEYGIGMGWYNVFSGEGWQLESLLLTGKKKDRLFVAENFGAATGAKKALTRLGYTATTIY